MGSPQLVGCILDHQRARGAAQAADLAVDAVPANQSLRLLGQEQGIYSEFVPDLRRNERVWPDNAVPGVYIISRRIRNREFVARDEGIVGRQQRMVRGSRAEKPREGAKTAICL
jgi:hypothetical protein